MKKIKKIAASIMAVAAMATSMVGISASAAVGSKDFCASYAHVFNTSGSDYNRLVQVSSQVYRKSTGVYQTVLSDSVVGPSGAVASVSHDSYPISSFKFYCQGSVYNGDYSGTGAAWSATPQWILS